MGQVPDTLLRSVVSHFNPQRVILIGSHARQQAGPDSDFGLFVIVDDETPPERMDWRNVYECRRNYRGAVDILPDRAATFEIKRHVVGSLPHTAANEGVVVYERHLRDRAPNSG